MTSREAEVAASAPRLRVFLDRRRTLFILAVFVLSRCAYRLAGVRFNASEIWYSYQLLPPDLLRHHLLESLAVLHTQPPGFNLLVGIGFDVAGGHTWLLNVTWVLMGAAIAYGVDATLRFLGMAPGSALVVTALFVVSPSSVLFENYLFYDYPLLLLLVAAVVTAGLFLTRGSPGALVGCSVCLAAIALIRPVFHPVAVIASLVLLVLLAGATTVPRRTLLIVGIVLLVPVALLVKNAVLFGQPTFSSWVGWNVGHLTTYALPESQRQHLVEDGRLSPVALVKPFSALPKFASIPGLACHPRAGDPLALTRLTKAHDDDPHAIAADIPNLNNRCYLAIYDKAWHDAIDAFLASPDTYAKSEARGYFEYGIAPASDYARLGERNLERTKTARAAEDVVLLALPMHRSYAAPIHLSPVIAIVYSLAVGGFVISMRRVWRRRRAAPPVDRLALWTGTLLVYGIVVSYGFDVHENMRFRLPFDPLAIALAAYCVRAFTATMRSALEARP